MFCREDHVGRRRGVLRFLRHHKNEGFCQHYCGLGCRPRADAVIEFDSAPVLQQVLMPVRGHSLGSREMALPASLTVARIFLDIEA